MPYHARRGFTSSEICCSRFNFSWSDIFWRKEYRGTKLLRAVALRHVNCVKRLIDEGADVNTVNEQGVSLLMIAATNGYYEILNILIEAGATVEIVTHKKTTSLMKSGVGVNGKLSSGKTALMRAANRGHIYCVQALLNAGADVNMTNRHGKAAISLIPRHRYDSDIVEMLIRAGADVNAPDLYNFPQILSVAAKGTCGQLKFAIESGADVNVVDSHNNSTLMSAAEQHDIDESYRCLRLLLEAGARINIVNNDNRNALSKHLQKKYQPDQSICLLLFAAGETVKQEIIEKIKNSRSGVTIPDFLEQREKDLDLKYLCREAIRNHLLNMDPHAHLFYRVPKLGLPKSIALYLLYDASLETKCTDEH